MILTADVFEAVLKGLKTDGRASDNRKSTRVGIRARLRLVPIINNMRGTPVQTWARDISTTGIGILHDESIKHGTRFLIELEREGSAPMFLMCEVVRREKVNSGLYLIGAKFISPAEHPATASGPGEAIVPPTIAEQILRIRNAVIGP